MRSIVSCLNRYIRLQSLTERILALEKTICEGCIVQVGEIIHLLLLQVFGGGIILCWV